MAALALLGVLTVSSRAHAEETVAPTEGQTKLYLEAITAYDAEEYERSVELLRSALALGEINLFYASLGRSLFQTGDCAGAQKAYNQALTAPAVAKPTRADVAKKVEEYRQTLATECPGELVVRCQPSGVLVSVDGDTPVACARATFQLKPGKHEVVGSIGRDTSRRSVEIRSLERTVLDLAVVVTENRGPVERPMSDQELWGWVAVGSGGGVVLASVLLEQLWLAPAIDDFRDAPRAPDRRDEAEFRRAIVVTGYVVGIAGVVTGATLLLLPDADESAPADDLTQRWRPVVSPSEWGMAWEVTW